MADSNLCLITLERSGILASSSYITAKHSVISGLNACITPKHSVSQCGVLTSFLNTVFSESSVNMTLERGLIPMLRVFISEVALLHVGMESE